MTDDPSRVFAVKRNRKMCVAWLILGAFCLLFASAPWYMLLVWQGSKFQLATHWQGLIFLVIWSALPALGGLWLLFHAICKIEFWIDHEDIVVSRTFGPVQRHKRYARPSTICLLYRWYHRKNGPDRKTLVVLLRLNNRKKRIVLDELQARSLVEVFEWLSASTATDYRDLRDHKTLG